MLHHFACTSDDVYTYLSQSVSSEFGFCSAACVLSLCSAPRKLGKFVETVVLYQGSTGDNSLQSLSDDLISNELDSIHSQQDVNHGSAQASESTKNTVDSARDQTASAVDYVEGQLKTKSDQVHSSYIQQCCVWYCINNDFAALLIAGRS